MYQIKNQILIHIHQGKKKFNKNIDMMGTPNSH